MTKIAYPDYEDLGELLIGSKILVSPAEVHGLLSGLLAAGLPSDGDWMGQLNLLINDGQGLPVEIKNQLKVLMEATHSGMSDSLLGFQLMLPDDEVVVEERTEALAQWVQSFLVGFGVVQSDLKKLAEDVQELVKDFTEISQLSSDLDDDEEENEQALFQVVEYVRIGAITIFAHLTASDSDEQQPTLH
ncbi:MULTISPECIES: UPF0149 family protein [unclassified Agarivorans]|uniref:UPF0149 family protein n=1 Tax=unclassified Agarivorans TaxID=2636026 RepID=UPI0026E338A3|nr:MULTISPECIES: UPF0149 family protein [unclassified Agarivorans]MDO6683850.1 UPF0149 family protein [Agarivorans sp. 3_MG-2023]MDO6714417.1 UPF0149 family protein [Agarivorans sp. 2_MG-2023]MDO6762346.1 UPF0149 family protein [Agarivorans sp. 1_MG-2023]